jgi:N-glycosylase/DNA lyase
MTLASGQAFRWQQRGESWIGVVLGRWVRLTSTPGALLAEAAEPVSDWGWLEHYLQTRLDLVAVLATFPKDEPMTAAIRACHGLRLLRQDPWECLASFILSSTKQILQIQQIVASLCELYGEPVAVAVAEPPARAFPSAQRLAAASESELRGCKMGFRAPFLLHAARRVSEGRLDLAGLAALPLEAARAELMRLDGVGRKISDCVLLFSYGQQMAFPVDVWITKALAELYFPGRKANLRQMHEFAAHHFGPNAGYAQQYLFHYARLQSRPPRQPPR